MDDLFGLKCGHVSQVLLGTGVTVFLFDKPAPCGYFLPGSAPALREIEVLNPSATITAVDALVFAGGSAYGLGAANGVMQWLQEQGRGYKTSGGLVPIVPTACLYDLAVKCLAFPDPEDAYKACQLAKRNGTHWQGQIGAATGATVGKGIPGATTMPGGFGYGHQVCQDTIHIWACVAVNCVGDVINNNTQVIAGARYPDGRFVNRAGYMGQGKVCSPLVGEATTLVAVFTNVALNKSQLSRLAKMASAGIARTILPAFTPYDGDIIFAASVGEEQVVCEEMVLGAMAAEVVSKAIISAVSQ